MDFLTTPHIIIAFYMFTIIAVNL